jgi:hypothetical protein
MVVFCWCNRGGLRGECGVLDGCFSRLKNTPPELNFLVEISLKFALRGRWPLRDLYSG